MIFRVVAVVGLGIVILLGVDSTYLEPGLVALLGIFIVAILYPGGGVGHAVTSPQSPGSRDSQERLLADTAHELRNPLAAVWANVDLLAKELDAQTRAEVFADCTRDMRRMRALIEDLLLLESAKSESRSEPVEVELDHLVSTEIDKIRRLHQDREIRLQVREQAMVLGEPGELVRVVGNLMSNALNYSDGPIRCEVWNNGGRVLVAVEDEGLGIQAEEQERIFERLYRVDSSRQRGTGGTGLGLAIVKSLLERNQGSIRVESRPGEGSRFTFDLPLFLGESSEKSQNVSDPYSSGPGIM